MYWIDVSLSLNKYASVAGRDWREEKINEEIEEYLGHSSDFKDFYKQSLLLSKKAVKYTKDKVGTIYRNTKDFIKSYKRYITAIGATGIPAYVLITRDIFKGDDYVAGVLGGLAAYVCQRLLSKYLDSRKAEKTEELDLEKRLEKLEEQLQKLRSYHEKRAVARKIERRLIAELEKCEELKLLQDKFRGPVQKPA